MQAQKAEGTRDLIGAEMRAWQKMQQIAAGMPEADLEVCLRCIRTMEANLARMAGE